MIKFFVTDLDGCISYPFQTPDWEAINEIRDLNLLSRSDEAVPPLTICTGRPYPYAEAVAQWLDIKDPFIFECAALYIWEGNKIETALGSDDGVLEPIRKMKKWIEGDLLRSYPSAQYEFTKMMDAGVVCPETSIIKEIYPIVQEKVKADHPNLEIHTTDVSVNVLMPGNNKLQGMKILGENRGIHLNEIAYIGDSGGDIAALEKIGMPFSPSNAIPEVKEVTENLEEETTHAVLKAYHKIIERNRIELN